MNMFSSLFPVSFCSIQNIIIKVVTSQTLSHTPLRLNLKFLFYILISFSSNFFVFLKRSACGQWSNWCLHVIGFWKRNWAKERFVWLQLVHGHIKCWRLIWIIMLFYDIWIFFCNTCIKILDSELKNRRRKNATHLWKNWDYCEFMPACPISAHQAE